RTRPAAPADDALSPARRLWFRAFLAAAPRVARRPSATRRLHPRLADPPGHRPPRETALCRRDGRRPGPEHRPGPFACTAHRAGRGPSSRCGLRPFASLAAPLSRKMADAVANADPPLRQRIGRT